MSIVESLKTQFAGRVVETETRESGMECAAKGSALDELSRLAAEAGLKLKAEWQGQFNNPGLHEGCLIVPVLQQDGERVIGSDFTLT